MGWVYNEGMDKPHPLNPRTLFVRDVSSGRIRFTRRGQDTWRPRLAKVGYDIDRIRTLAEFEIAVDAFFAAEFRTLAAKEKGKDPLLAAILAEVPGWKD